MWIKLFDVLNEFLKETRELIGSEGENEFITMVVQVDVVSFSDEAFDIGEADDLFCVGGECVLCADNDDVREKS